MLSVICTVTARYNHPFHKCKEQHSMFQRSTLSKTLILYWQTDWLQQSPDPLQYWGDNKHFRANQPLGTKLFPPKWDSTLAPGKSKFTCVSVPVFNQLNAHVEQFLPLVAFSGDRHFVCILYVSTYMGGAQCYMQDACRWLAAVKTLNTFHSFDE